MKKQVVLIIVTCLSLAVAAQEKPPICMDDYIFIEAGGYAEIEVLANDWWMTGHEVQLIYASQSAGAFLTINNNKIQYYSHYYFEGIDTVLYSVKDLNNNMISETGYLIATVDNPGKEFLDINNIRAMINAYGYQFCDLTEYTPWFEVPKGSGKSSLFSMTLWMGGKSGDTSLHVAAERYRQSGEDYFNGPFATTYPDTYFADWNRLWKNNRETLEYHQSNWNEPGYAIPQSIQTWPAHGQEDLGQAHHLAPFIDWDDDAVFQPEWGDMPAVRGDQNLFFIYNDDLGDHTETGGHKIGVEILGQAYAYDCSDDSTFNNSIFMHYDIINRSGRPYVDFYTGVFADFDLGYAWDDYTGCDTINQAIYVYNGDSLDDVTTLFGGAGYGEHPPAMAIVLLNRPLCACLFPSAYTGPSALAYSFDEVYHNLQGLWRDGTPVLYNIDTTTFMFTGNPVSNTGWTEAMAGNQPNDRRALASAGPQSFLPGDTLSLDLGFVWARDYQGDNLSSLALLQQRIAILKWYYENDSTPCAEKWFGMPPQPAAKSKIQVMPNPVKEFLLVHPPGQTEITKYQIVDISGRVLKAGMLALDKRVDCRNLNKGIYIIQFQSNGVVYNRKFVKQ